MLGVEHEPSVQFSWKNVLLKIVNRLVDISNDITWAAWFYIK